MIHYTCDMCGRPIQPEKDTRYKVEITVELKDCHDVDEYSDCEEDEVLRYMLDEESPFHIMAGSPRQDEADHYKRMVYDLCQGCRQAYVKNPLFKNVRNRFGFTEN